MNHLLNINRIRFSFSAGVYKNNHHTYKAFRHVQNLFIQGFLFIHLGFVFIVQPITKPVQ